MHIVRSYEKDNPKLTCTCTSNQNVIIRKFSKFKMKDSTPNRSNIYITQSHQSHKVSEIVLTDKICRSPYVKYIYWSLLMKNMHVNLYVWHIRWILIGLLLFHPWFGVSDSNSVIACLGKNQATESNCVRWQWSR